MAKLSASPLRFQGLDFQLLASGALWWPALKLLCVSDLHLGKSARYARMGGATLPPYETTDTLRRIEKDLEATASKTIVCLGDSFDTPESSAELPATERQWLLRMMAGKTWIWIEGNHDPGPIALGGTHRQAVEIEGITFRHIAKTGASGEISGHFHPKVRVKTRARSMSFRALLADEKRIIMPAYGTYTGGLWSDSPILSELMDETASAYLLRSPPLKIPMPRQTAR